MSFTHCSLDVKNRGFRMTFLSFAEREIVQKDEFMP